MNPLVAGALVFFTSGTVLVLEILAGRLLAPYVGVSLETYTAVIGTVLAGIASGTWLGGYVADRFDPRRMLGPLLIVGGGLCLATVPLVRVFGSTIRAGESGSAVMLAIVAFFAPAAVLSAASPAVVKLQLRDLAVTGGVVGQLSAFGTAGALVGTFLAGFVLVEAVATTTSIVATGVSLMIVGAGLSVWLRARRGGVLATVAALALAGSGAVVAVGDRCHVETVYHCARVLVDRERPGGRLLELDTLNHSYVDLDDPTYLQFRYTRVFADVLTAVAPEGRLDVLHVGGGGFTIPRYLKAARPGSASMVLEIDRGIVDVARTRLGLVTGPDLEVRVGDARRSILDLPRGTYDVVVGDAFGGRAVPWHLTTVEFIRSVHASLRPGGLYLLNVIDYPPLRFGRAEVATLLAVFENVLVVAPPGGEGGNLVLAASDGPLDGTAIQRAITARGGQEAVTMGRAFADDAPVLTDDYAPVDQWLVRVR